MSRKSCGALAIIIAVGSPAPVTAQDWLGVHLESQREENLRRHQQGQAGASGSPDARKHFSPPISGKARHAAMRRHHREYGRIMKARGYRAADQWLADQVAAGR